MSRSEADRLARRIAGGDRSPATAEAYAREVGAGGGGPDAAWISTIVVDNGDLTIIGVGRSRREAELALLDRYKAARPRSRAAMTGDPHGLSFHIASRLLAFGRGYAGREDVLSAPDAPEEGRAIHLYDPRLPSGLACGAGRGWSERAPELVTCSACRMLAAPEDSDAGRETIHLVAPEFDDMTACGLMSANLATTDSPGRTTCASCAAILRRGYERRLRGEE